MHVPVVDHNSELFGLCQSSKPSLLTTLSALLWCYYNVGGRLQGEDPNKNGAVHSKTMRTYPPCWFAQYVVGVICLTPFSASGLVSNNY